MTKIYIIGGFLLFVLLLLVFSYCKQSMDEEERIKKQIVEFYAAKYNLENEPIFEPIFDEIYKDTIYRYYWELNEDKIDSYLEKFNLVDKESISIRDDSSTYHIFGVVFNRKGQIIAEGFFNENLFFTGINNWYDENWHLTEKHVTKLGHSFYEVIYKLDDQGKIIDSTYQYFPIVFPDIDTFEGPSLSICFDVQLIIDKRKYNYEDFQLAYFFYDSKNIININKIDLANDKILGNLSRRSTDGYFHFCYDLEVKYHLMSVFGIYVDEDVSEQDLTFGEMKDPIINKNIDSHEL